jgi:hypothetical protein
MMMMMMTTTMTMTMTMRTMTNDDDDDDYDDDDVVVVVDDDDDDDDVIIILKYVKYVQNAMCQNLHWTNEDRRAPMKAQNRLVSLYVNVYKIVRCVEGQEQCYLDIFDTAYSAWCFPELEARGLQTEGARDTGYHRLDSDICMKLPSIQDIQGRECT